MNRKFIILYLFHVLLNIYELKEKKKKNTLTEFDHDIDPSYR